MSTQYYINQFTKFNNNNGKYVRTWNWAAFLFGPFWYFYQGIWVKGILYSIVSILIIVPFGFLGSLALGLYYGFFGNWDYYLKEKGILLWPFTTKLVMLLKKQLSWNEKTKKIVAVIFYILLGTVIYFSYKDYIFRGKNIFRQKKAPIEQDLKTQFYNSIQNGDYDKAEEILNKVLIDNPNDCSALDLLGNFYFHRGAYEVALNTYNKAISINPKYAHTYFDRGSLFLNLEDYNSALSDMKKAVELDPNCSDFRLGLGTTYYNLNKIDEALYHLSKAVQLDPMSTSARCWLGFAYIKIDNIILAKEQFDWILKNDPESFEAEQIRNFINSLTKE